MQGVSFRQSTVDRARSLGLRGWVANTQQGTVRGEAVGGREAVEQLKRFVEKEGSPASRIDRVTTAVRDDVAEAEHAHLTSFDVRRERG